MTTESSLRTLNMYTLGIRMITINVRDARTQLKTLLDRVSAGEEIAIQRHGKTVAKLVPPSPSQKRLPSLKSFRSSLKHSGPPLSKTVLKQRNTERY